MRDATRSYYQPAITRVVEHIVTHLDRAVALDELADLAGTSPFHFHRICRGMLGETPLEMARRIRLERAAHQLVHSSESVTRIAFAAGFDAHEAFTRAFRSAYGQAPSDFRRAGVRRFEIASMNGVHFAPDSTIHPPRFRDTGGATMQVEIETLPARRLAIVRHTGPYNQIGAAFQRLGAIAGPAGLIGAGSEMIALYHDAPEAVPVADLRSDAALVVSGSAPLPPGVTEGHLPAGRYARTTYRGSYEGLGDAWARFMGEWLPASGHRLAEGPALEVYRDGPMFNPGHEPVTDLYVPILEG
jgi:AraC family transcriptional regulator